MDRAPYWAILLAIGLTLQFQQSFSKVAYKNNFFPLMKITRPQEDKVIVSKFTILEPRKSIYFSKKVVTDGQNLYGISNSGSVRYRHTHFKSKSLM